MPKRVLQGEVVSNGADKTVIVKVVRQIQHPLYKKIIRKSKKYAAHDEKNECVVGQKVTIEECRPLSKRKNWKVVSKATAAA